MSDTGNISGSTNIGRVNVALEVTGVKEANATLDAFAAKAKSIGAAGGSSFAGGSSIAGFTTSGHAPSVAGFATGAVNSPMAQVAAQAPKAAAAVTAIGNAAAVTSTKTQVLGSSLTTVLGRLFGIGAVVHVFNKLAEGVVAFTNASADLDEVQKNIESRFKIQTDTGLSTYEQLTKSSQSYYQKEKDDIDKAARSYGDYYERALEGKRVYEESEELQRRRKANDDQLIKDQQIITAAEKNSADARNRELGRSIELEKTYGNAKIELERKFALEDAKRNQDPNADADLKAKYDKEIELINKKYDVISTRESRRESEEVRNFQAAGARAAASRFGPGNGDLNTLILKNIYGALQNLQVASRRF